VNVGVRNKQGTLLGGSLVGPASLASILPFFCLVAGHGRCDCIRAISVTTSEMIACRNLKRLVLRAAT